MDSTRASPQIGLEGDDLILDGVAVWRHSWQAVDAAPLLLPHPSYPAQRHPLAIYRVEDGDKSIRFAAGELSNGVWGFYLLD